MRIIAKSIPLVPFFGSLALLAGCAASGDLISAGTIKSKTSGSRSLSLTTPTVREEGQELIVYGTVQRRDFTPLRLGQVAHVHVLLVDASGQVLSKTATSSSSPIGRGNPRAPGPRSASYRARLQGPVPARSTVRVAIDSAHDTDTDEG